MKPATQLFVIFAFIFSIGVAWLNTPHTTAQTAQTSTPTPVYFQRTPEVSIPKVSATPVYFAPTPEVSIPEIGMTPVLFLPYRANLPVVQKYAMPTPGPTDPYFERKSGAVYQGTIIHRLTACENHGMLRAHIWVTDRNGNPLNGITILRLTDDNQWPAYATTGDKGDGQAEFDLQAGDPSGGNWHIQVLGGPSDIAWNIRTDLWLDESCGDQLGVYHGHISYDVYFQKTN